MTFLFVHDCPTDFLVPVLFSYLHMAHNNITTTVLDLGAKLIVNSQDGKKSLVTGSEAVVPLNQLPVLIHESPCASVAMLVHQVVRTGENVLTS